MNYHLKNKTAKTHRSFTTIRYVKGPLMIVYAHGYTNGFAERLCTPLFLEHYYTIRHLCQFQNTSFVFRITTTTNQLVISTLSGYAKFRKRCQDHGPPFLSLSVPRPSVSWLVASIKHPRPNSTLELHAWAHAFTGAWRTSFIIIYISPLT